jgi:hypothetical protein
VKIVAWVVAASMTAGIGTGAVVVAKRQLASSAPVVVASVVSPVSRPVPARPLPSRTEAPSQGARPAAESPITVSPVSSAPVDPVNPAPGPQPAPVAAQPLSRINEVKAPPAPSSASLEAEVALVRDARAALSRDDAAHALALLDDHARRFPDGAMAQDRDALQVFATCAAGQSDAARELATRFLSLHAASPYAASVKASCTGAQK